MPLRTSIGLQDALNYSVFHSYNTTVGECDTLTSKLLWQNVQDNYNLDDIILKENSDNKLTSLSYLENISNFKNASLKMKKPIKFDGLVAIFETQTTITAQTCEGVLLSAHWVLTEVSCVVLLANYYSNV
ncbi:unnamed protein product [Leptidea sinapis]|uniref:Peptidase S1 domain-containing protein n=1 Tax=Leptidea sinapis TaxID=189913 RepID=A0A5E4Q1J9_9NEOP|nr:unnamed protein product [Leptidea sinapis]